MSDTALLTWTDGGFLAAVDEAFASSAGRSGAYLVCRPGCNQCCTGTFSVSMLDAQRLQQGYLELAALDRDRFQQLHARVSISQQRLAAAFPGDPATGLLFDDDASQEAFEDFGNDEVCPVLNPRTGTCDLYASRPMTCRVFGPPVRTDEGLGLCELCFNGATDQEVADAEMFLPPPAIEAALTEPLGSGTTIIAFALPRAEIS